MVLALWPALLPAQPAPAGPPVLLVLLSGAPDNSLETDFLKGLRNELRLAQPMPPVPHSLHINFLELQRFRPGTEYRQQLAAWLTTKYQGVRFDAVITNNVPALEFALAHRELWQGAPLIFAGLQAPQLAHHVLPPEVHGATIAWDIEGTVDLALALLPKAREAAIVLGRSPTEVALAEQARGVFARSAPGMQVVELANLPWHVLMARISSMHDDSFILAIGATVDPQGRALDQAHALRLGTQAANVPAFTLSDANFPLGSVGGSLIDFERIGQDAARRALQQLANPGSLPAVEPLHATRRKVDARVLERWGIDEARVPEDTLFVNRVPTLWRDFRAQVVASVAGLVLLTAFVAVLLVERRRRRHAETEAKDRLALLARMDRIGSMGQLSASLAHEINQPLGAVRNYAEGAERLLGVAPLPLEKLQHALSAIRRDSQRASDVIGRMRAMFGGKERPHRRLDLTGLVAETKDMVDAEATRRGVALSFELPALPVEVDGDDVQLQQLLVNLLLNALDAAASGRDAQVRVSLSADAAWVRLGVADNGLGMSAEQRARVFEPFFTTKEHGMGMGLALVRQIVDAHGGEIEVTSAPGGGTRMDVRLPMAPALAPAAQP